MAKKHKNWKPQVRKRQKKTTGKLQLTDVIYIDKERIDGVDNVFGTCTCGEWRTSPEAKTFTKIGKEAKQHVLDTGHQLRFHAEV